MSSTPATLRDEKQLDKELEAAVLRSEKLAQRNYITSLVLMASALLCSVAAAFSGVIAGRPQLAGSLAIAPPLIAYIVVNLKLDGKAKWHYRKMHALNGLLRKLRYETPLPLTLEQIGAISTSFSTIENTMNLEWDEKLAWDWDILRKGIKPQPKEPSEPPTPASPSSGSETRAQD